MSKSNIKEPPLATIRPFSDAKEREILNFSKSLHSFCFQNDIFAIYKARYATTTIGGGIRPRDHSLFNQNATPPYLALSAGGWVTVFVPRATFYFNNFPSAQQHRSIIFSSNSRSLFGAIFSANLCFNTTTCVASADFIQPLYLFQLSSKGIATIFWNQLRR